MNSEKDSALVVLHATARAVFPVGVTRDWDLSYLTSELEVEVVVISEAVI